MVRTDFKYEAEVNKLIPLAVQMANVTIGDKPEHLPQYSLDEWLSVSSRYAQKWNHVFHLHMDRLCFERGIRTLAYQADQSGFGRDRPH